VRVSLKAALAALALALSLGLGPVDAMSRRPRVDKSMQTSGAFCRVTQPGYRVARSPKEWAALWRDIGRPAPVAAMRHNFAVAVFAGTRESGGFAIEIDDAVESEDKVLVRYSVIPPKGMATMALTQPYAVRLFPATKKTVVVEERAP
jgi:hypothetical protein